MTRPQTTLLVTGTVAVLVLAIVAAVTIGRDDEEAGTDAHVHIEPISTADEVAVAAMAGIHTWTPATQQSPWDALHAISDRLTGKLAEAASSRPESYPTPRQWQSWARAGDRVIGAAELSSEQEPVAQDAATAQRSVQVRQRVLHADGATTPLEPITIAVELERVGQDWKAANYRYTSIGSAR